MTSRVRMRVPKPAAHCAAAPSATNRLPLAARCSTGNPMHYNIIYFSMIMNRIKYHFYEIFHFFIDIHILKYYYEINVGFFS